jgi:hypothetical protein
MPGPDDLVTERRIPEEGNPSLEDIREQIAEGYFDISDAETCMSDVRLQLYMSKVHLLVSLMNNLMLSNIFGPKREEITEDWIKLLN